MDDDGIGRYHANVGELLDRITSTQRGHLRSAAELLADQIERDGLIHVFGVGGHSAVGSEEFFYRAGGLACISPIFDLSLSLEGGGQKSTLLERLAGYGDRVIAARHLDAADLLVITSIYGMNACTIDAAMEAKRRGCRLVAITSVEAATRTPKDFAARHPSGQNLHELADVTIDTGVPYGEVCIDLPGFAQGLGGTCNILQCFCINALVIETVQVCLGRGIEPPVWKSANVEGGDEANRRFLQRYTPRVKYL